jgi:regulation of enolase protein 1 (concanavalin A-like superfamily)
MMRTVFAGYSYLGFIAESAENLIRKINRNFAVAMNVGFRRDVLRLLVA